MAISKEDYKQIVKLNEKMMGEGALTFATVTAFDGSNRTVKVVLEPNAVETGWCKCLQGAYADKVGLEVLVGRVSGSGAKQYVVIGILE